MAFLKYLRTDLKQKREQPIFNASHKHTRNNLLQHPIYYYTGKMHITSIISSILLTFFCLGHTVSAAPAPQITYVPAGKCTSPDRKSVV